MPPPANPWPVLESIRGLSALPDVWAAKLAENLPAFKILCLQESPKLALAVTCPRDCGCYHTVIHRHDHTGAIAICRCDPPSCPDIPVTIPEITPLEVNRPRLGRALAKALNCQSKTAVLKPRDTYQFGSWSADAVPVILTMQADPYVFRSVITELALRLRRPFILFAPTNGHLEGLLTLPSDSARYGPWAGKLLTADRNFGKIFAVNTNGAYTTNSLGFARLGIDCMRLIETNQPLYCVGFRNYSSLLLKIPGAYFKDSWGDILMQQSGLSGGDPALFIVHWNSGNTNFETRSINLRDYFDENAVGLLSGCVFAPIELRPVP